jgi:hypothetical protein
MTLANDNKISILTPDFDSVNSIDNKIGEFNVLNEEHQPLFFSFLKIMRQLYRVAYQSKNDRFMRIIKVYNKQLDEMENRFIFVPKDDDDDSINTYIQSLLFNPNDNTTGYSWGNIFCFIYRKYKHQIDQQQKQREEIAHGFRDSFEKDAPFIAALHLKHFYDGVIETKSNDIYITYMNIFPEEQQDWYKSNSLLQTPIIENIAPNCNCLPRHLIQCSVCN